VHSKIVFSNENEIKSLLIGAYVTAAATIIPFIGWYLNPGEADLYLWLMALQLFVCFSLLMARRFKVVKIILQENCIELEYPLRDVIRAIPYSELQCAEYTESSFSLSLVLKDSRLIPLSAGIEKIDGHFSPYLEIVELSGPAGDRYRLKHEIEERIKRAIGDRVSK
jgi:hypothetical protein